MDVDVVVIGAGQAGLASAYGLTRQGVGHVVLDAADGPGGAWRDRWETLSLGTTHHVDDLPGLPFGPQDPDAVASVAVPAYYGAYKERFGLDVQRPVRVRAVRRAERDRLAVETSAGSWLARGVVNATGTWTRPFWPSYPGQASFRGRQLHTADYRGPQEFAGQHVVVVGGGASAVQLLGEISRVTTTSWATRRPPVWREGPFTYADGRAAVARVERAVAQGRAPASVVSATGLVVTPWVAEARERGVLQALPAPDRLTPDGLAWDGPPGTGRTLRADVVLWATGFRPALGHLAPLRLREPGGGIRMVGTRVEREPRLHLVGYGPSASTIGASRAGRAAARELRTLLAADAA